MRQTLEAPGSWAVPSIQPDYENFDEKEIEHGLEVMLEVEASLGDVGNRLEVDLLRLDTVEKTLVESWGEASTEEVIHKLAALIRCAMRILETSKAQDNDAFVAKTRLTMARAVHVQKQVLVHAAQMYPALAADIERVRYRHFVNEAEKLLA